LMFRAHILFLEYWVHNTNTSHATAQAVSRWFPTAAALLLCQVSSSRIFG
jgi:hypothetical protein